MDDRGRMKGSLSENENRERRDESARGTILL